MQRIQKPTLTGQRIKTRKRDEKEKFDPSTFRDQIVTGLNERNSDLEKASSYLIQAGSKLDFRRYAEALFDILFTGGILAPGGTVLEGENCTLDCKFCIFKTDGSLAPMQELITSLFSRTIRQFKYLEKSLEDEMKKVLQFLKGFNEDQRQRLSIATYLLISSGLCSPSSLTSLVTDHLVKDGIALDFMKVFFQTWLEEKDFNSLVAILRKAEIDGKLLELIPINKRSLEYFEEYFTEANLPDVVKFQHNQCARQGTKELKAKLKKIVQEAVLNDAIDAEEIITACQGYSLTDQEIISLVWANAMKAKDWNKKEDLLAVEALRYIKLYLPVFKEFSKDPKGELVLINVIQEHCYDNMNFMKVFQKIIMLLYKNEVISEDVIINWYRSGHSMKGKSLFLGQMEKMVEWLQNAEEESSDEEED